MNTHSAFRLCVSNLGFRLGHFCFLCSMRPQSSDCQEYVRCDRKLRAGPSNISTSPTKIIQFHLLYAYCKSLQF